MTTDIKGPVDLTTPVGHVATELDRVAPAALTIEMLADSYTHPNTGDVARVRRIEGVRSEMQANRWLIRRAIAELRQQVEGDESNGYRLAVPFDDLRYLRRKVHRRVKEDERDEQRRLKAVYSNLVNAHAFDVLVAGRRGPARARRLTLHPLARAIPVISEREFGELADDIRRNGIELPIIMYDGHVLDGRHRVAIASALNVPVQITEVTGDEARARARVISLNVSRRHLTTAQAALIVRELFLPDAKEQARERQVQGAAVGGETAGRGRPKDDSLSAELRGGYDTAKAVEQAVQESGRIANIRSVEALAPVDNAPRTKERIYRGEIKTVAAGRREALKELGRDPEEPVGVVQPRSAWDHLGAALGSVKSADEAVTRGHRGGNGVTVERVLGRIAEIDTALGALRHSLGSPAT